MCGFLRSVWMAQCMDSGASHQPGSTGERTRWLCFEFGFLLFEGEGGVRWRSCIMFGHKFEMSGDIWVEMLWKAIDVRMSKKPREVWAEGSSWETSGCVQMVTEAVEVTAFREKCRQLESKPWGPPAIKRLGRSLWQECTSHHFGLSLTAPPQKHLMSTSRCKRLCCLCRCPI